MSDEESKYGDENSYEDNEDEEEEYEDDNNYVQDDFINDEEEEEESHHKRKKKHRKRKRKRSHHTSEEMDEDDLDVINAGRSRKMKRLRKATHKETNSQADLKDETDQYADEVYDGQHDEFIEHHPGRQKSYHDEGEDERHRKSAGQLDQIFGDSDDDEEIEPLVKAEHDNAGQPGSRYEEDEYIMESMHVEDEEKLRNDILKSDIPERLYVRLRDRLDPSEDELEMEARWIYEAKKHWQNYNAPEEKVVSSIKGVLKHFRVDKFDIPFLATYRCYLFQQELQTSDFYEIYEMDLEWSNFLKTKRAIEERLDSIRSCIDNTEMIDECLALARSNEDLEDIHYYFEFLSKINPDIAAKQASISRDHKRKKYRDMIEAKIDKFAKEVCLDPSDFAKNLRSGTFIVKPPKMSISPSQFAETYKCEKYNSILNVFVAAVSLVADSLAAHPIIRKCITEKFIQGIQISTKPTEKGLKELDVFHPSYRVKRLQFVPIEKLEDDLWADIEQCEQKKLIDVIFENDNAKETIIDYLRSLYYESSPEDNFENDWKTFYFEIIDRLINSVLIEDLKKRARKVLRDKASQHIISCAKETFCKDFLMVPPALFEKKPCYIVAFVMNTSGGVSPTLTGVAVSETGELRQHMNFNYICIPFIDRNQPENLDSDIQKMKSFVADNKAGLVVLGANSPDARGIFKILEEKVVCDEIVIERLGHKPEVTYGSLEVPQIAANSAIYSTHYRSLPLPAKQALSLARFKQSPVSETLKLWNDDERENMHVFSLNLHPFQKYVPQDKLVECLRNVTVSSVNMIGVDLHAIICNDNLHPCMQFISGLGPVKATEFIKRLMVAESVASFRMEHSFLTSHVHYNAVGFINAANFGKEYKLKSKANILDSTRIHPEFYSVASKIAKSALDEDNSNIDAVEEIIRDPSKLRQLDLVQFSRKCEAMFGKDYKSIFDFIKNELESPFRDIREKYNEEKNKMVNQNANIFFMLTGETPQTFFEGLVVPITITKLVQDFGYSCKSLSKNSWAGFIPKDSITDPQIHQLNIGVVLNAKINKIEYENFSVKLAIPPKHELISEKEALDKITAVYRPHFQVKLHEDAIFSGSKDQSDRFGPGNKYKKRISYASFPHFKNVTCNEAIKELAKEESAGGFIIRPSPKGDRFLNITLRYYQNHFLHMEIEEAKTDEGTEYRIHGDKFGSLQEIEYRYIREFNKRIQDVKACKKFVQVYSGQEFEQVIRDEKQNNPDTIPYKFTMLEEYPGHVVLMFLPGTDSNSEVKREFIKVKPTGFWFHNCLHKSMMDLICFFKSSFKSRNYRKEMANQAKAGSPRFKFKSHDDVDIEPVQVRSALQDWQAEGPSVDETPFPAKTTYISSVDQMGSSSQFVKDQTEYSANFSSYGLKRESDGPTWGDDDRRPRGRGSFRGRGGGPPRDKTCYNCGEPGHFSRECPKQQSEGFGRGRGGGRGRGRGRFGQSDMHRASDYKMGSSDFNKGGYGDDGFRGRREEGGFRRNRDNDRDDRRGGWDRDRDRDRKDSSSHMNKNRDEGSQWGNNPESDSQWGNNKSEGSQWGKGRNTESDWGKDKGEDSQWGGKQDKDESEVSKSGWGNEGSSWGQNKAKEESADSSGWN